MGALLLFLFWLASGGGVYLIAYGDTASLSLSLFVVMVAWPLAIAWWSLWYVAVALCAGLIWLGIKSVWDEV